MNQKRRQCSGSERVDGEGVSGRKRATASETEAQGVRERGRKTAALHQKEDDKEMPEREKRGKRESGRIAPGSRTVKAEVKRRAGESLNWWNKRVLVMTRPSRSQKTHVLSRLSSFSFRMFSLRKGQREHKSPTGHPLPNGLHDQGDQHLQHLHQDHPTCTGSDQAENPNRAIPPSNGYNPTARHLASPGGGARPDVAGQTCEGKLNGVSLTPPPESGQQHSSVSVNFSVRECSFVALRHHTEPRPFRRKCGLDTPTGVRGRGNCGVPVVKQQSGSVSESDWTGASKRGYCTLSSRQSQLSTSNGQGTLIRYLSGPCLAQEEMLSSQEVKSSRRLLKVAPDGTTGESRPLGSHDAIRNQIQRVVVNLEEVLHGLREIHLEMKEVVQKIDLLTADLDVEMWDPEDTLRRCQTRRETRGTLSPTKETIPPSRVDLQPPRSSPPPVEPQWDNVKDQKLKDAGQRRFISLRHKSGTMEGHLRQKPPPYPFANTNPSAKLKGQKAPPYPFRRRLLSTIV